ncbi:MAG: hypothetical protein NC132_02870 [Corallococcus sp.]|nr:hypothetical protein [Corallococcus sp.]MCM1359052.1 hypothetical protein [Corallococcus sp.]MCM1395041.1 hypothetical protein [Corallococcus sp.]
MTLTELTAIISTSDKKAITKQLKEIDYIDCKKHKEYCKISLATLLNGDLLETDEFSDRKGKCRYQGGIITRVKGYEQLEFLLVNINDDKNTFPIDMIIMAKEIKND